MSKQAQDQFVDMMSDTVTAVCEVAHKHGMKTRGELAGSAMLTAAYFLCPNELDGSEPTPEEYETMAFCIFTQGPHAVYHVIKTLGLVIQSAVTHKDKIRAALENITVPDSEANN